MGNLLCEPTGQMQVSGCFTCTITGHRMGAGGNEISSCAAGASKVCAPSPFCTAWGIEFRHERAREARRERRLGETPEKATEEQREEREGGSKREEISAGWMGWCNTVIANNGTTMRVHVSRADREIDLRKETPAIGRPSTAAVVMNARSISVDRLMSTGRLEIRQIYYKCI